MAYGDSSAQALDLYLPTEGNGPWPLVFFVHGGWFSGGKKDGQEIPWVPLRDHGYAVASVNYRLSGEAPHPAGMEDCETALRFLTENAAAYHIDPAHVATAGGSSGGHYALMLALDSEKFDISCCVAWYPATDLAETMRTVQDSEYTGFGADFARPASARGRRHDLPHRPVAAVPGRGDPGRWRGSGGHDYLGRGRAR